MIKKEQLEQYFIKHKKAIDVIKILRQFKVDAEELPAFLDILVELEKEGKIMLTGDNKYLPVASDFYLQKGVIKKSNRNNYYLDLGKGSRINITHINEHLNAGDCVFVKQLLPKKTKHPKYQEGELIRKVKTPSIPKSTTYQKAIVERENSSNRLYVKIKEEKIYLKKSGCNSAYPGDTVSVLIDEYDKTENALVTEIIKRKQTEHVFECRIKDGIKYWAPIGTEFFKVSEHPDKNMEVGTRVIASMKEKVDSVYHIDLLDNITSSTPLELEVKSILAEHHFNFEFPKDVLIESKKIEKNKNQNSNQRVDLRHLETFTIDSSHAKDLDDAISLEKIGNNYRLYVHIADVSNYIKPSFPIYEEAIRRSTSIYMPNCVIPMLPSILSNHICSLNQNEDKLTKTCMIDLDEKGEIINFEIYKSIIRSDYKMCYEQVDALLTGNEFDINYLKHYETLMNMYKLAILLQKKRISRGDFCLQIDEMIVNINEYDTPISLESRCFGPSSMIIENFMLLANQVVTDFAYWLELPFVYRNHDAPPRRKSKNLEHIIGKMTSQERKNINVGSPKCLQQEIFKILAGKNQAEKEQISKIMLKNFTQAYYKEEALGHYGLALDRYATFTSPIRRAPDLLNHTFLDQVLSIDEKVKEKESIKEKLPEICIYITERQKEAEMAEREIDFYLIQMYAKLYQHETLNAKINYITEEGMYIKTNNKIPGFIKGNKRYQYQQENTFFDTKEKVSYHIGDSIDVQIKATTCKDYTVPFEICYEEKDVSKVLSKQKK